MNNEQLEKLKFPIGEFTPLHNYPIDTINAWINTIDQFPEKITTLVKDLSVEQLNWIYRPEGWSLKQVVHHCADSHMNALIRFKLTITETAPTIRPYYENRWANLADATDNDLQFTLQLLMGLHKKWAQLLRTFSKEDLKRAYIHPEHGKEFTLEEAIGLYAWHCDHHYAHIIQAIKTKGEFNKI